MVCWDRALKMANRSADRQASNSGYWPKHEQASDGVPVKINSKLFPPIMDFSLPKNFSLGNPSEFLFMEYDFSLEKRVLQEAERIAKQREAEEVQAKTAQLAAEVEKEETEQAAAAAAATAMAAAAEGPGDEDATQPDQPPPQPQLTLQPRDMQSLYINFASGSILTPTPITPPQPRGLKTPTRSHGSAFNIADFENEQDPFDNLELKTLNDMEELNKVLQGAQPTAGTDNSQSRNDSVQTMPNKAPALPNGHNVSITSQSIANTSALSQMMSYKNLKDVDYPDIDSLHLNNSNAQTSASYNQVSRPNVYSRHGNAGVYYSSNYNNGYVNLSPGERNSFTKSPPLPPIPGQQLQRNGVPPMGLPNSSYSQYNKVDMNPFTNSVYYTSNGYVGATSSELNPLRSTRSTPDITKLDEKSSHRMLPTSHTPPPYHHGSGSRPNSRPSSPAARPPSRPNSRPNTPPPRPFTKQNWTKYNVLPPAASTSPRSIGDTQLPDPYPSMSHEAQRLVNTISDMGFRRARVARAVHKLGQDERKVLDHLCAVNRVHETHGFSQDDVETALHQFDQNEDKTVQYLKLLVQFKELGFPDDKVKGALIAADLNENKALDVLTST